MAIQIGGKMHKDLYVSLLSKEMRDFLGEFVTYLSHYSYLYVLECEDGRKYTGSDVAQILDKIEAAMELQSSLVYNPNEYILTFVNC
jgi:hypothetical protein